MILKKPRLINGQLCIEGIVIGHIYSNPFWHIMEHLVFKPCIKQYGIIEESIKELMEAFSISLSVFESEKHLEVPYGFTDWDTLGPFSVSY